MARCRELEARVAAAERAAALSRDGSNEEVETLMQQASLMQEEAVRLQVGAVLL